MDPNACLDEIRRALADGDHPAAADAFVALDDWLTRGGFAPTAWYNTPAGGDLAAEVAGLTWAADVFADKGYETLAEQVRYAADRINTEKGK